MKFVLTTDTSCDVRRSELAKKEIPFLSLTYTIEGQSFSSDFDRDEEYHAFYERLLNGAMPTTSQITPHQHEEFFTSLLESGAKAIVHLSLSGGLSATAESAKLAAKNVTEQFEGAQIYVVDTLAATQAHNYLLERACELRDAGKTADEVFEHLEELKHRIHAWFSVDDLMHLRRGGRVNVVSAVLGTLLKIKPILIINKGGGLSVVHKAKGNRRAMEYFFERLKKLCPDYQTKNLMLVHADCHAVATEFKQMLIEGGCTGKIEIGWVGPVIGSHTGAGLLGLVFEADTGRSQ